MADRTANTVFYPSTNPKKIDFSANASDADTITIPFGVPERVLGMNSEDDDDVMPSASVSGGTITFKLVDDAGTSITVDTDLNGTILLRTQ